MRFLVIALIVGVVVMVAVGPLVLGRRQVARETGRPFERRGLLPAAIVVGILAAALTALSFAVRPGVVVMVAAAFVMGIAALILVRARPTIADGLPPVPTLLFIIAGGAIAAVGIAALAELLIGDLR